MIYENPQNPEEPAEGRLVGWKMCKFVDELVEAPVETRRSVSAFVDLNAYVRFSHSKDH